MQITDKCLSQILELEHLEDLILEGCYGINDDSLAALKLGCKSLEVLISRLVVEKLFGFGCFRFSHLLEDN